MQQTYLGDRWVEMHPAKFNLNLDLSFRLSEFVRIVNFVLFFLKNNVAGEAIIAIRFYGHRIQARHWIFVLL